MQKTNFEKPNDNNQNYYISNNKLIIEDQEPPIYRGFIGYLFFILKIFFVVSVVLCVFYGLIYLFKN